MNTRHPSDSQVRQDALASAHQALTQKDLSRALTEVEALLTHHPDWAPAVHLAGLVARALGDASRAEDLMRRSLELPGVTAQARAEYAHNLGNLLRGAGYPAAAESAYRLSLAHGELPQARLGLARSLIELERPDDALDVLRSIDSESSNVTVALLRAEALAQAGERREALEALTLVSDVAANRSSYWISLGARLASLGRFEDAETALLPLLNTPDAPAAILALGEVRVMCREWDRALAILRDGVRQFPRDVQIHSRYASLAWMMGETRQFAEPLRRELAARPTESALRLTLASALANAGQHDESERLLREGHTLRPNDPHFTALLALRCAETERTEEAQRWIGQALTIAPEFELVREQAAIVALTALRSDEALTHTRWLIEQRPSGQLAWALHGVALRIAGDSDWKRLAEPTLVCRTTQLSTPAGFSSLAEFNRALADVLRKRHTVATHPLVNSVRNGTQVEILPDAETDPLLRTFLELLRGPIEAFAREMPDDATHPLFRRTESDFRLSGCWTVRLRGGSGRHVSHIHPRGWLSSAYYVSVPDSLAQDSSRGGWLNFGRPPYPIAGLEPTGWVKPMEGTLALFPSYQWHGVEPFSGGGERLSIAFDVIPRPQR